MENTHFGFCNRAYSAKQEKVSQWSLDATDKRKETILVVGFCDFVFIHPFRLYNPVKC